MENMTRKEFEERVTATLESIIDLFKRKTEEYRTEEDPMANFKLGGALRHPHRTEESAAYEALKDYVGKHIAQVFNQPITEDTRENWKDIIAYSAIAVVMLDKRIESRMTGSLEACCSADGKDSNGNVWLSIDRIVEETLQELHGEDDNDND